MTDETPRESHEPAPVGLDRRTMLRRGAAVGALVWTVPVVESFTRPAAAGSHAGEDCKFDIVIRWCVPRSCNVWDYQRRCWTKKIWQDKYELPLTFTVTGECCQAIKDAIKAYGDGWQSQSKCLALINILYKCGCFNPYHDYSKCRKVND